jgi:outer membrane cobalamin receptor
MKVANIAVFVIVAVPLAASAANLGLIDGTVRDSGSPVAGVHVLLLRDNRRVDEHVTDANGHFEFEQVPFGSYQIKATSTEGKTQQQDVRVASGDVVEVELALALPSAGEEMVVTAQRPKAPLPAKTPSSTSTLEREEIRNLPRGDTASVNEILSTQPGFVYDAMGNLFARGNHANIQYQIDGVPLPDSASGLFGGFLSPKLVENMEVITGGLDAEYGERLAAVVNLNTRRPSEEGEGQIELMGGSYQTLSPSILYGKKFGALSVLAGGSYRTTQRALDPQVFEDLSHDAGNEQRAFLRLDYDMDEHTHWSALGSFAHNFYRLPIDTSVPQFNASLPDGGRAPDQYGNSPSPFFPANTDQTENERDLFALLSFRDDFNPRSSFRAAVTYRRSYGFLFGDAARALGPTADPCLTDDQGNTSCSSTSDVGRTADHLGLNAEQLLRLGENNVLKVGGQVDQLFGSTDYTSYTRNDVSQGPDPARTVHGTDTSRATTGGFYVQDRATFGRLVVNAGVRLDFQRVTYVGTPEQATQVGVGPRLGIAYALNDTTIAHAFAGLLWQPPPVLDAPAAARILGLVSPGQTINYDLRPEKDRYAEVGVESRVIPALTLKLNAWGRLSSDQLDDVGVGSTNLVSPYNFRDGRAAGVEGGAVLVLGSHFTAFGNASLARAEGRGIETAQYLFSPDDLANDNWQTLDHVQVWTANAGATVKDGHTRLSSLVEYGSGLRTGANNNQHVPDHVRVDASLSHQFFAAPTKPTIAFDVVNLFDAHYAYRIANGFNGSHWAPGRGVFLRVASEF